MISKNKFFIVAGLSVLLLAACGQTAEDEAAAAVHNARDAFEMNRKQPTEKTQDVGFYKPAGWKADVRQNDHTIVLTKGKRTVTAQYDPNAKKDSKAYYNLLRTDAAPEILAQETFSDSGSFGFIIIRKQSDELAEIVAGSGPAQVTAIVGRHDIEPAAEQMMEIARSLEIQP
ncbi:hypothetical protein NCCP2716_20370 [Sporosarcina sp. NCCP-2716]|uniref:hypothetical protein n=1 Tax=Sporosarcina sp. NCCP-2716 TaxID=2943679 RepID=UPI00203B8356|nr:hypothetical protein [Sporosarcina sp. NCCP-2716]GKV69539.1 hypothetical protein NCCP2716_20370 [Sporosarcina sp. NCCP-2716]